MSMLYHGKYYIYSLRVSFYLYVLMRKKKAETKTDAEKGIFILKGKYLIF